MVFLDYPSVNFNYDKVLLTLNNLIIPNYNDDLYDNIYDHEFEVGYETSYQYIYGFYKEVFIYITFDSVQEKEKYRYIEIKTTNQIIISEIKNAFAWLFE